MTRLRSAALGPWLGHGGRRTVALTAVTALVRAVALVVFADAVTRAIVSLVRSEQEISGALTVALAAAVIRAACEWAARSLGARGALAVGQELRQGVLRAAAAGRGDRSTATTLLAGPRLDDLQEFFVRVIPAVVSSAVIPLVVGARVLSLDLVSAVILVVTLPLVPLFMVLVGQHTQDHVDRAAAALDRLADHLVELARGLPVLSGLGRLDDHLSALDTVSGSHRRATMSSLRVAFLSALVLELIATISVAVVAVFVGVRLVHGDLPLEVGLLVLILAPECYTPFRELGTAFHASRSGMGALRDARRVIDAATPEMPNGDVCAPAADGTAGDTTDRPDGDTAAASRGGTPGSISVTGLTVGYPVRTTPALTADRLVFPANAVSVVVSRSGGGKSTLLTTLVGRLDPAAEVSGEIVGLAGRRIAWMPQSPRFFGETASSELALLTTVPGRAAEAIARAGLPERLATAPIVDLSPGERRRLAFARVLVRVADGADLVVLDEPTAHLDEASALAVVDELWMMRGAATVIVASHDPRVTRLADHVVPLDGTTTPAAVRALANAAPASDSAATSASADAAALSLPEAETAPDDRAPDSSADGSDPALPAVALRDVVAPVAGRIALGALVAAGATASAVTLAALSGWLIVRASEQPPIMYLLVAIVGVRFFGIARAVLRYLERLTVHDAALRMSARLRAGLWGGLAAVGPSHRRLLSGDSVVDGVVAAPDSVRDLVPRVMVPPAAAVLTAIGAIVTTGLLAPELVVPLAAVLGVGLVLAPVATLAIDRSSSRAVEALRSSVLRRTSALLSGMDELAVHGIAPRLISELGADDAAATRAATRAARAQGAGSAVSVVTGTGAALAVLTGFALTGVDIVAEPALIAVLTLLPLALVEPVQSAADAVRLAPTLSAALARLPRVELRAGATTAPPSSETPADPAAHERKPHAASGVVVFDDVAIRWPGMPRPTVTGADFEVRPGSTLAVSGPSGSGKSTLLAAALGQLPVAAGEYRLDGESVLAPTTPMAGRVAWCPQESHVFRASIRANLRLARPRDDAPTDAEMNAALRDAGLAELLAQLPDGLDTSVGAEGASLSGGERQRLALARALLTRAPVLLLDEPTAHLDASTADRLRDDLRDVTRDRSVVLVSHDAADLARADALLVLSPMGEAWITRPESASGSAGRGRP